MSQIAFPEVARLVNRIPGTRIDIDSPRLSEPDHFAIYGGTVSSSTFKFDFEILHLYAGVTKSGVKAAQLYVIKKNDKSKIKAVYSASVTQSIVDDIRRLGIECILLSDYFFSFMSQQAESYLINIKKRLSINDYIDPQIDTPSGLTSKIPNPVLSFMRAPKRSESNGEVAVILGEPGQGKTHMSKYLAVELSKRKLVPIYVHSEQWAKMQVDDISSIWKTIVSSFRYFDAPIGWAEGIEREFLRVSLKLGIFKLIFDGFDEFILWNRGTVDPQAVMQELVNLAEDADATLCITSRTSFWKAEIGDLYNDSAYNDNTVSVFEIKPFDVNHARNYFGKRFEFDENKQKDAIRIFEKLKAGTSDVSVNFIGRGFFLALVADLVDRGFNYEDNIMDNKPTIQWVMNALCKREQVRQSLPIDAQQQLEILREFSEITAEGEPKNTATLEMVIGIITDLDEQQIRNLTRNPGKLKDHPLLVYDRTLDVWSYAQNQIEYVLIAERILEICENHKLATRLAILLKSDNFTKALQAEVAASIVQYLFESSDSNVAFNSCKKVIATVSNALKIISSNDNSSKYHSFLGGQVALLAADHAYKRGSAREDRTRALLNLLPSGSFKGLYFFGAISGYDFRDIIITDCYFDNVTFINCRFSNHTKFSNCCFVDLRIYNCERFGLVDLDKTNRFDNATGRLVEAEMVLAEQREYGYESLNSDIDYLVRRFLPHETSGYKNIEERNLYKGLISHSKYKNEVITEFKKVVLCLHHLSGTSIYSVCDEEKSSFAFYVGNGVLTGGLATLNENLIKKLRLTS